MVRRWFEDEQLLRSNDRHIVDQTIQHLHNRSKQPTAGRVVAELPFRFWVALFANPYDTTIWRTDLHRIFTPRVKDRRGLHDTLDRLRTLRNRIAHHEPIFHRRLDDGYRRIRNIVGFLSPPTLTWLDHTAGYPRLSSPSRTQFSGSSNSSSSRVRVGNAVAFGKFCLRATDSESY